MASGDTRNHKIEISEEPTGSTGNESNRIVYATSSKRVLLQDNEDIFQDNGISNGVLDFTPPLKSITIPGRRKDDSQSTRANVPFAKKIKWDELWKQAKVWIKDPINMALSVWIIAVAISGAILFMVMTGMLNRALPKKSQRDTYFEVSNQILNALFTLMCLYQHPKRFHHLILLCRWRADDISKLRKLYCKNGTCKPNERKHMAVVIFLLHLNCFAQYGLCALNLGFRRSDRPAWGVGLTFSVAFMAPAIAAVYTILSPLGKDYEIEVVDEETSGSPQLQPKSLEKRYSFSPRDVRVAEHSPHWVGGLFDIWDDLSLAYLSLFCCCCVFGWNMSRLGFGNMYVHIATFILFCLAPFFIFNLAAVNIDDEGAREALGLSGMLLCVFGLLYGGFWRIKMRHRYNLPGNDMFCGKPDAADCLQWLCCYSCSLSQEVRTADFYDVVERKFYPKLNTPATAGGGAAHPYRAPLPMPNPNSEYYQYNNESHSHGSTPFVPMSGSSSLHLQPSNAAVSSPRRSSGTFSSSPIREESSETSSSVLRT